jgi:Ca2+-binding RTX toxin-like protein
MTFTWTGTFGDDTYIYTGSDNFTGSGLEGNDLINGASGNDSLTGGAGDDTLDRSSSLTGVLRESQT